MMMMMMMEKMEKETNSGTNNNWTKNKTNNEKMTMINDTNISRVSATKCFVIAELHGVGGRPGMIVINMTGPTDMTTFL